MTNNIESKINNNITEGNNTMSNELNNNNNNKTSIHLFIINYPYMCLSKIKNLWDLIFPTEKISGNQTWDCFMRNPNGLSLYKRWC